jgi:hypothetical protein
LLIRRACHGPVLRALKAEEAKSGKAIAMNLACVPQIRFFT